MITRISSIFLASAASLCLFSASASAVTFEGYVCEATYFPHASW
jgi:hypothetical protein